MTPVCRLDQLVPERGAAAIVDGHQVAVFRIDEPDGPRLLAVDHHDPCSGANVLARGIVGTAGDRWYVASPIHKQRFDLETGQCLDDETAVIGSWSVALIGGDVCVGQRRKCLG